MRDPLPWFKLRSVPGIGNHLIKRLIDQFLQPERVFAASRGDLLQIPGMSPRLVANLRRHRVPEWVFEDFDLAAARGYGIVTMADGDYPPLLLHLPDPPPYLFVYGRLTFDEDTIAVVGSRNATAYGISTTRRLSRDLAARGVTVISGMALGIDTAAHEGALDGGGRTIAVLGSGLERIYPARNRDLFHAIAAHGAVVSEFPLRTEPEAYNFPIRNRIISGMARGTVIVEATKRSGSLITARLAAEQGREVFAVPGSIQSFKSTGTHTLIKQGAKLVEHVQDIFDELPPPAAAAPADGGATARQQDPEPVSLTTEERAVWQALEAYPVHIDDLARRVALDVSRLSALLMKLEIRGLVQQAPGKYFTAGGLDPEP